MSKRVFFSFDYEDVKTFRANVVRNHSVIKESGTAGFFDASIWEDAEKHGCGHRHVLLRHESRYKDSLAPTRWLLSKAEEVIHSGF